MLAVLLNLGFGATGTVVVLPTAVRSNRHTLSPVSIRSSASPSTKRLTISEVEIRRTDAPSKV